MCCKLLWPTYCASAACTGRQNGRCRDGPFDGRRASIDGLAAQPASAARGAGGAYTCAVIVYNPRAVTHFIPQYSSRVFPVFAHALRTHALSPHSARTVPRPRHSCTHQAGTHSHQACTHYTLFFAHPHFFVAIVSHRAIFAHV